MKNYMDFVLESVRATPGVTLLDVDPGKSTNRYKYKDNGLKNRVIKLLYVELHCKCLILFYFCTNIDTKYICLLRIYIFE